jgi:hypothetical protein
MTREDCNQCAAQMWTLVRLLPFMIATLIPPGDETWQLFILLRQIMSIVFAPKVTKGMMLMLEEFIVEHHTLYRKLYPDDRLKPKHHFLLHYGRFMQLSGPLVHKWAMRFEAKHRFFKKIPAVVPNFKNICKTYAYRHSMSQYFVWQNGSGLKSTECGPGKYKHLMHIPGGHMLATVPEINTAGQAYCVKWVKYCGCKYSPGLTVAHSFDRDNATPEFGKIHCIIKGCDESVFLLLNTYKTLGFDEHYYAYILDCQKTDWIVIEIGDIVDYHPVSVCSSGTEEIMVSLRYHIFC